MFGLSYVLDVDIKEKLINKHKVYEHDLEDALGDPCMVVIKNNRKSPELTTTEKSNGRVYELYASTINGRVLFIVGRLFSNGNLYIITAYWADKKQDSFYQRESEVLCDG